MITISDCEAFCDADQGWVRELARREQLGLVQAYAQAQHSMTGSPPPLASPRLPNCGDEESAFRQVA